MPTLQDRIARGGAVILDGAMGTELQRRGVPMDGIAWSAAALATHPEAVRGVHEDYLRAGAEILITNSFAASRHVLAATGLGERVAELAARYDGTELPIPDWWGGLRLSPDSYEFWQHREDRLHDRLRYARAAKGGWEIARLAP